jgi:MacB-like periplasmic core domain
MTRDDLPENVNVIGLISNGFYDLGVPAALGRGLSPSDAIEGRNPEPVAVLSYQFWQERMVGDVSVVGKTLQLDRRSYTIAGVAAPNHICIVDFRLRPGVTRQAANAALEPLLQRFARGHAKALPKAVPRSGGGPQRAGRKKHRRDPLSAIGSGSPAARNRMRERGDSHPGAGYRAAAGQYDDSREEFQTASQLDPGFAMAYWGEAPTYNIQYR